MPLDTTGALLEGIRVSSGNNPLTFPSRSVVSDPIVFNSIINRAEYVLIINSTNPVQSSLEIADPNLQILWTKNQSTITRFSYDNFSQRWLPSPGNAPDSFGVISNNPRLIFPVPDNSVTNAPFAIYIGDPVRLITFNIQLVGTEADFTDPNLLSAGTVQLSNADGKLNFCHNDLISYAGKTIFGLRQSFFDRASSTGAIGTFPLSLIDYHLCLNPKPATGQIPRVRIGYRRYLTPIQVANESVLGSPISGTFTWSLDTGRVRFSTIDVISNFGETIYYDGVIIGSAQYVRHSIPVFSWPTIAFNIPAAINLSDTQRFIIFAEKINNNRNYWTIILRNTAPTSPPAPGKIIIDISTGNAYISAIDINKFADWSFFYLDSLLSIEHGISIQLYRSGVNGSGPEKVPDFTILYNVEDQIIVNGLQSFPFVMLPTNPIIDSTLKYEVVQGPASSGTFTGELVDGINPSQIGLGYILNLDTHQFNFSNRKIADVVLAKATTNLKLADSAVSERGFEITVNGSSITPDVDFDFDANTGMVEFIRPFGHNDPNDKIGMSGSIILPSTLVASSGIFSHSDIGRYIVISTGANLGIYVIRDLQSSAAVTITSIFKSTGIVVFDLHSQADIIVDKFWTKLDLPYKKFSLARADAPNGQYVTMATSEYEVFPNTGQVNLTDPAQANQSFQIMYVALETTDDGATYTPINKIEKSLFKIRQETASTVPGSTVVTFNPDNNVVNTTRPIIIYVNGIILSADSFEFNGPGTIKLANPIQNELVVLDYWVENAPGGNTNFNLLSTTIDLDTPQIKAGVQTLTLNGDQTDLISTASAMLIDRTEVILVDTISYDSNLDVSNLTFITPIVSDSDGSDLLVCGSLSSSYFIAETAIISSFVDGTNFFYVAGDATFKYKTGTIITINNDPYYISNSQLESNNRTKIFTSIPARRNYIIPDLAYSVRTIQYAGKSFHTNNPINLSFPFTLILNGDSNHILTRDIDFSLSDGGDINLESPIGFGNTLSALYVARTIQPIGTIVHMNYSYVIAPGLNNGLLGQRLQSTYNLYAPDTFFYRVETITSFLPEVQDALKQSSQSGGVSGPNIGDATGQSNKDFGISSPWFDEQHQHNLDVVMARLIKFYNDLINYYEDILSNLDGRIVGGISGRFRFDDMFDNPPRNGYIDITNDIDDKIKLYDKLKITGFFTFQNVPVFGTMAVPNNLSRLFPTTTLQKAALNDLVNPSDFGKIIGSLAIDDIRSIGTFHSSPASQFFSSISGAVYTIIQNGDPEFLIPPFSIGQDINIYANNGSLVGNSTVVAVTNTTVTLSGGTSVRRGNLVQNISDPVNPHNHFYTAGRDLAVNTENGQIVNITVNPGTLQIPIVGNEIIESSIGFGNSDIQPRRIPVLDGLELNDNGYPPVPRLKRISESELLLDELDAMSRLGTCRVSTDLLHCIQSSLIVSPGDDVTFLNGPNAGSIRTINTILSPSSFSVDTPWPFSDTIGHDVQIVSLPTVLSIVGLELEVLNTNSAGSVISPALIASLDSELKTIISIIQYYGRTIGTGLGSISSNTLTDMNANFTLAGVNIQTLLYVGSGPNVGLYKIVNVTSTTLTVDGTLPWASFPNPGESIYQLIQPESFLATDQFSVAAQFLRELVLFVVNTLIWQSTISVAGKTARIINIEARQTQIFNNITRITDVLTNDSLYDQRFLFIEQRIDKKDGNLTKQKQAEARRKDNLRKLIADQQKLLISESL
jgi:hypothetical protein